MSFPEAVQYLADKAGMTLPESNQSGQDASREKYKILLRDMNKTAAAYFHYIMRHTEHGKKAYEYFKGRGLSDERSISSVWDMQTFTGMICIVT